MRRAFLLAALLPAAAFAFGGGMTSSISPSFNPLGSGCGACHTTPGAMPATTVMLSPASTSIAAGQPLTLTLTVTNSGMAAAGFNLSSPVGTFTTNDANGRVAGGQVTHSTAKAPTNGASSFTATWTAPATAGSFVITGWGNAVNLSGTSAGDRPSSTSATVTVTCSPTAEVCDGADNNCNSQIDENVICPAGQVCSNAACRVLDAGTPDAGSTTDAGVGADGGAGGGAGGGGGTVGGNPGGGPSGSGGPPEDEPGCGCNGASGGALAVIGLALMSIRARRRKQ